MRATRFFFGRLNLIAEYSDKRAFLLEGLRTKKLLSVREHVWGYFEVDDVPGRGAFLTGYLVKLRREQPEEVGNLRTHELALTNVANRAIAKARFFLDVGTGLIAFQHVSPHIEDRHFREHFAKLLVEGFEGFFVSAEVQSVEERFKFMETLATYESVSEVSIALHPSNPSYSVIWRPVDDRLKSLDVGSYREVYQAKRGGGSLKPIEDQEIKSKVVMAEDGYGEARASGVRDGRIQRLSTAQNPVTGQATTQDATPESILEQLMSVFQGIMERITRE